MIEPRLIEGSEWAMITYDVDRSRDRDFIIEFYPEYATWFLFHPELF